MQKRIHFLAYLIIFLIAGLNTSAQDMDSIINNGGCKSVIEELEEKYEENNSNLFAYSKYLHCLFQLEDKRKAKKLIQDFSSRSKSKLIEWDRMAYVIAFENNWDALQNPSFIRNHFNVSAAANRWRYLGLNDIARVALENSGASLRNPSLYQDVLEQIYTETEEVEKLMPIYIKKMAYSNHGEEVEAEILSMLDDPENMKVAIEYLEKQMKSDPRNVRYKKLMTWIYESKDDWSSAMKMVDDMEVDFKTKERAYQGLIADAMSQKKYDIVQQAYEAMEEIAKTPDEQIHVVLERIHFYKNYKKAEWKDYVEAMGDDYDSLIFQKNILNSKYLLDYTDYYYLVKEDKYYAIDLLEYYLDKNSFSSAFRPEVELKLGDYFAQDGNRWDAVVYYTRVENSNKNKSISEEARFRNAKISYFYGDFEWTKKQLEILKSATQEPIANNALELWLRIIENTPSDSDFTAMQTLAKAEWHIWMGNLDSASAKLNTIGMLTDAENPIMDDVYLIQAEIAHELGDYEKERTNLERIIEKYPDNVISDDAYYRLALLNIQEGKNEEAKLLLEQFLLKYENSALLIEVRALLNRIRSEQSST